MRLKKIDISGFRGFPRSMSFDLSADATILIGANGLGKTSLLDAIHWGLCGRLPRLGVGDRVVSLYSETGQARTTLDLAGPNGEELSVVRRTDGESQSLQVVHGGQGAKGSAAKAQLIQSLWPDALAAKDEDEVLSSTLTRCVYLQQDRIRDFIESTSDRDRFGVISELVGTGRLNELQAQIESENRSWSIATGKLSKEGNQLAKRVEDLESQVERLKISSNSEIVSELPSWESWWNRLNELGVDASTIPEPSSPDAATQLADALQRLESNRSKHGRLVTLAAQLRKLAKSEPDKPLGDHSKTEQLLQEAKEQLTLVQVKLKQAQDNAALVRIQQIQAKELREQQKALAKLAVKLLEDRCPVCQQEYDVEATRSRLESIIEQDESDEPVVPPESVDALSTQEGEASKKVSHLEADLRERNRKNATHEQWKNEVGRICSELGISTQDVQTEVEAFLERSADRDRRAAHHVIQGEALSANLARESAKSRLLNAEKELEKAQQESLSHSQQLASREHASSTIRRMIEELREANSKLAVERLKEIEPFLQRIYARIDPHPAFRVVKFVATLSRGKGRLNAVIKDEAADVSSDEPSAILSSSQLNALAVAVFLSFNLTVPRIPVDVAMLDDPMQSLDDINLLGLVDLLRRTKDERQLIVSTHDSRFGELLARKLRPASPEKRTSVIELRAWSRSGPDVDQYEVEPDISPLRLAEVG